MDIKFKTRKLEKLFNSGVKLQKKFGSTMTRRIIARLSDLQAADNLEVMRYLPGRCHELKGDRKLQLSLDLYQPYRLIFEPFNEPVPLLEDGGLDWKAVTIIRILEVADTHE